MDALGSVVAIMDLSTGAVVELDSTFASNPDLGDPCHGNCGEGQDTTEPPAGRRTPPLLAHRDRDSDVPLDASMIPRQDGLRGHADGGNLRQLVPTELAIRSAAWSPDGSMIVLTQSIDMFPAPEIRNWQSLCTTSLSSDPTELVLASAPTDTVTPLGTDAPGEFGAQFPTWTRDGRIAFVRNPEQERGLYQLWVVWTAMGAT